MQRFEGGERDDPVAAGRASAQEPVVLATKLHPPRRRRTTVARPRLTERALADLPALTLVSAPAGFGKTTFLAEWLAPPGNGERRLAWLSLEAGDDDPTRFWASVVAAVRTVVPGAGAGALSLLHASAPGPAVVTSLVNDLAQAAGAPGGEVVLVLDDYHLVGTASIHEAVAFLVDHLPYGVHLVIAGRADPPLPLARLRASGDLLELRARDLRFTPAEATTYLNDLMGLALTRADVEVLEARTEGWAAALQLAALSMQGRTDPAAFVAAFAGDDRFVVDYLAEEVLERQSEEVRRFLLDTSILDRFTGPLCDAVTDRADGRAMLDRLDRANLFLVALDDQRRWFRYHHLFAHVLRARLADEDPARADELHRRASAWHEAAGEEPEAIVHALAGHDVERAARLIEQAAPMLFRTRQEATARRWLTALPDGVFADRPVLAMEKVGALMVSGDTTGVEGLLDGIERWLDAGADLDQAIVHDHSEAATLPAQVAVYRAALALIAGDLGAAVGHAERALALTPPRDHLRRGSASAIVGLAEWATGDLDAAIGHYADAMASLTAAGHISDVLGCSIALADMQRAQGRLGDALSTYDAALALATERQAVRGTPDMHVGRAEVLLERGDVESARRALDASAALGEASGLPQHPYRWRVAAARLAWADGDTAGALALLAEAERRYDTDMSPPVRPVAAMRAKALLASGDLDGARRWAAGRPLSARDELTYLHEFEHLVLARVLLAVGTVDEAVALAERLQAAASAAGRDGALLEILVVLALARDAGGDRAGAVATLADALRRAEPEGYLAIFVEDLPALAPLLRAVPASGAPGRRARMALATAAGPGTPSAPPGLRRAAPPVGAGAATLADPLSERELEVLRLLRGDLSGPDMARQLHVSLNTLRTHTKRIYLKLGATNRREAVRRAGELGL